MEVLARYGRARESTREHVFPANPCFEACRECPRVPASAQADVPVSYPRLVVCLQNKRPWCVSDHPWRLRISVIRERFGRGSCWSRRRAPRTTERSAKRGALVARLTNGRTRARPRRDLGAWDARARPGATPPSKQLRRRRGAWPRAPELALGQRSSLVLLATWERGCPMAVKSALSSSRSAARAGAVARSRPRGAGRSGRTGLARRARRTRLSSQRIC